MGKSPFRRGQRSGIKTLAESNNPSNESSGGYEAPTVGYKEVLYLHDTTKVAAMFGMVNTKLSRFVSVQSWTGATITDRAMEKLAEPTLIAPKLLPPTKEYEEYEDQEVPDPDNDGATMTTQVLAKNT